MSWQAVPGRGKWNCTRWCMSTGCANHLHERVARRRSSMIAPAIPSTRLRVAFVMHVMQVAGAEVLVTETIRRLGTRIEPTVFCLDAVGPLGEQLLGDGVAVISLNRRPGRDWR